MKAIAGYLNSYHEMPKKWYFLALFVLFMISFGLRLNVALNTHVNTPVRADAYDYYQYALNLSRHGIYSRQDYRPEAGEELQPDKRRTPGYVFFIMPFVEWPPTDAMITKITAAQALISALTVIVTVLLFAAILRRELTLLVGMFVVLSPHLINASVYLLTETVFTFTFMLFLWSLTKIGHDSSWRPWVLAGVCLGVTVLIRPTANYLILFLIPLYLYMFRDRKVTISLIVLALSTALVISPWLVHKFTVPDRLGATSLALDTIHKGMYPDLMYQGRQETFGVPNRYDPKWSEMDTFAEVSNEIASRVANEPLRYLYWYSIGKPKTFLSWDVIVGWGDVFIYPVQSSPFLQPGLFSSLSKAMKILHWPITLLALIASIVVFLPHIGRHLNREQVVVARVLSLAVIYFVLVHTVGTPLPRYAYPIKPLIFGMAIWMLWYLYRLWSANMQARHEAAG